MELDWIYNGEKFTEELVGNWWGFVYIITNLTNNKSYIGKKQFTFAKTKQVNKKKKKIRVPSDWMSYYGSNEDLKKDVELLGVDKFRREVLYLCKTKGECSYLEAKEQFDRKVLENDAHYNSWIMCRVHKTHIKNVKT